MLPLQSSAYRLGLFLKKRKLVCQLTRCTTHEVPCAQCLPVTSKPGSAHLTVFEDVQKVPFLQLQLKMRLHA